MSQTSQTDVCATRRNGLHFAGEKVILAGSELSLRVTPGQFRRRVLHISSRRLSARSRADALYKNYCLVPVQVL